MFGLSRDPRKKKLKKMIELTSRIDDEAAVEMLRRLKSAAIELTSVFESIDNFEQLKFALRPDQALLMAEKAVELQDHIRSHPIMNQLDEMVFFFCEASLRHKAGEKWVGDREVKLIDELISTAERMEVAE